MKAIRRDPLDRFQSAGEMADDLSERSMVDLECSVRVRSSNTT